MLENYSTTAPPDADKKETKKALEGLKEELSELQNLLFATRTHALLVVVQGMDASGKDGLIKDVFGCLAPEGVEVHSFKQPSAEEAAHDFLWRVHARAPARGKIGVWNRSHYEEVLVPALRGGVALADLQSRIRAINDFERHLSEEGTLILKLYLHTSEARQLERLEARLTDPRKAWKHSDGDGAEVARREDYLRVYEHLFQECAAPAWHVVPADQNWYKTFAAAGLVRGALAALDLKYPAPAGREK